MEIVCAFCETPVDDMGGGEYYCPICDEDLTEIGVLFVEDDPDDGDYEDGE